MDIIIPVLIFAVIFTLILSAGYERERDYVGLGFFFLLLFLPLWVLALAIPPMGPVYAGIAWFDIFIMAILISLFIAAATPPYYYRLKRNNNSELTTDDMLKAHKQMVRAPSFFFWAFGIPLVLLLILFL
ncbi:MAG: hypothetical protein MK008_11250 [Bdellovibrionales bacterium]|nr:hypothetical protein [Bdellovibrionales bacterium]